MESAKAQRTETQMYNAVGRRPIEIKWIRSETVVNTRGEQKPDRHIDEPPQRKCQRTDRRTIKPLDIVDCDKQRPVRCQASQQRQHRRSNRAPVKTPAGEHA
jgi:hypothetical protein